MLARDIMSIAVISVGPDTSVAEIAAILTSQRISGVPVLENGRPVGMVNEIDLQHRHELGTERAEVAHWWVRLFRGDPAPSQYAKSHALKAKDIMTRTVVSVSEDTPLSEIATLLDSRTVRRVLVVREGKVVGIITRANLVQALAASAPSLHDARAKSDEAIRNELVAELERQPWWHPEWSTAIVTDGVVRFRGVISTEDQKQAARVAAENVAGVRKVEDLRQYYVETLLDISPNVTSPPRKRS